MDTYCEGFGKHWIVFIYATFCVIATGASPGQTKNEGQAAEIDRRTVVWEKWASVDYSTLSEAVIHVCVVTVSRSVDKLSLVIPTNIISCDCVSVLRILTWLVNPQPPHIRQKVSPPEYGNTK